MEVVVGDRSPSGLTHVRANHSPFSPIRFLYCRPIHFHAESFITISRLGPEWTCPHISRNNASGSWLQQGKHDKIGWTNQFLPPKRSLVKLLKGRLNHVNRGGDKWCMLAESFVNGVLTGTWELCKWLLHNENTQGTAPGWTTVKERKQEAKWLHPPCAPTTHSGQLQVTATLNTKKGMIYFDTRPFA